MSKEYKFIAPKKVDRKNLTGNGKTLPLTEVVETIVREKLYRLEYYIKIGKSGIRNFKGTEEEKIKCENSLKWKEEVVKELRGYFPEDE